MTLIGWLGALMLAACGLPQALKVWRTGRTRDLSWWFLWLWGGGELCCFAYVLVGNVTVGVWQWPLLANYVLCLVVVGYLLTAKATY